MSVEISIPLTTKTRDWTHENTGPHTARFPKPLESFLSSPNGGMPSTNRIVLVMRPLTRSSANTATAPVLEFLTKMNQRHHWNLSWSRTGGGCEFLNSSEGLEKRRPSGRIPELPLLTILLHISNLSPRRRYPHPSVVGAHPSVERLARKFHTRRLIWVLMSGDSCCWCYRLT